LGKISSEYCSRPMVGGTKPGGGHRNLSCLKRREEKKRGISLYLHREDVLEVYKVVRGAESNEEIKKRQIGFH